MTIIISIIAIVALVCLYDYFSARNWQQVTSDVRNDVVFENRNKKYGAYAIRRDYNKRMILIMAGMVGSIGAAYGTYAVVGVKPKAVVAVVDEDFPDTVILDLTKKDEVIIEPAKSRTLSLQNIVKFTAPEVTDTHVDENLKLVDENTLVGNFDQKGKDGFDQIGEILDSVPMVETKIIPPVDTEGIVVELDEDPQYPGGRTKMIEFFNKNLVYPEVPRQLGIEGKCWIRFVVNKNGEITNVKVTRGIDDCPECGKEAMRVINAMPKWKPGKVRGQAVNSYFDLPVNFQLGK